MLSDAHQGKDLRLLDEGSDVVTLDGQALTNVNVIDPQTLQGIAPAVSAALVDLQVTIPGPQGTTTLSNAFTYQDGRWAGSNNGLVGGVAVYDLELDTANLIYAAPSWRINRQ